MHQPFPPSVLDCNAFFPFRPFVLPPHLFPFVASISLILSSGFYAWMCPPCFRSFLFIFQVSLPYRRADRTLELNKRIEFFFNWYLIAVPYGSKLLLGRFFLCIHKCVLCWLKLLSDISFPSMLVIGWLVLYYIFPTLISRPVEWHICWHYQIFSVTVLSYLIAVQCRPYNLNRLIWW